MCGGKWLQVMEEISCGAKGVKLVIASCLPLASVVGYTEKR